ncbi:ABC transporter ATP-binding protein [Pseudonocardia acaciae]|uniref:ABC transporter ATP-binding protein n=1 Tax=Pseudonocardia acaciae TaxID=551276 RepID=UPI00048F9875|nr:ABC transporter ATP-binding protein [Pseudonocardia acaciae]
MLSVDGVTVERERLPVVRDVSLSVEAGAITVLLGANGAGKTTLLEGISGIVDLAAGTISLDGARIDRKEPFRRVAAGLAHVEEGRSVFPELTTTENLLVASGGRAVDEVFEMFPELAERRHVAGGLLSGGEQQMLVLGRALLLRPKALMVDELSQGLAPRVVARLMAAVRELADAGIAVLLVEQFARLALELGRRAYVLRGGEVVYDGGCAELRASDELLESLYLGEVEAGNGARRAG